MGAGLLQAARAEHVDGVGIADGGEPVGNDDQRLATRPGGERLLPRLCGTAAVLWFLLIGSLEPRAEDAGYLTARALIQQIASGTLGG